MGEGWVVAGATGIGGGQGESGEVGVGGCPGEGGPAVDEMAGALVGDQHRAVAQLAFGVWRPWPRRGRSLVVSSEFDPANRLTSLDGASRVYDPAGNLSSNGTSTYTWNARGELSSTTGAVGASQMRYEPLRRRVGATVGSETWNLR